MSNCPLDEVRMETCPILTGLLKRLAGFTVAGFAVVILAGPILSALVTLGVFALIAFLLWLPLHTAFFGPHSAWRSTCEGSKQWRRRMAACVRSADGRCHAFGTRVMEFVRWVWPPLKRMSVEGFSGAAVAILVALLTGV